MADRGMVVKCYEFCRVEHKCFIDCPYWDNKATADECTEELAKDVLTLLKEQQPKTGHWLKKMSKHTSANAMGGSRTSACDSCGGWGRKTFKYCPHCGAKMEEQIRT